MDYQQVDAVAAAAGFVSETDTTSIHRSCVARLIAEA
jgi:hypothetical protein